MASKGSKTKGNAKPERQGPSAGARTADAEIEIGDEGVEAAGYLTPKQERFCQEYVVDLNGKQAAIRAGYSPNAAEQQASRLLTYAKVVRRVEEMKADIAARNAVTVDRVIAELAKIGFSNHQDYVQLVAGEPSIDLSETSRAQWAAIKDITVEDYKDGRGDGARDVRRVKIALHDKSPALGQLGKHLGLFPDRHEHTGPKGGPIQTEDRTAAEALFQAMPKEDRDQVRQILERARRAKTEIGE